MTVYVDKSVIWLANSKLNVWITYLYLCSGVLYKISDKIWIKPKVFNFWHNVRFLLTFPSIFFFSKSTCLLANRTQLVKGIIKFGINIYYVTSFDNSLALKI